jgi:hypothetical protein
MKESKLISEIIKIEFELTMAVLNGHQPTDSDIYCEKRKMVKKLRKKIK